ncbi:fk506-binding protein [Anaeramoeba ignava]|uniref:Fk506-binding protein n=1 Tax=Anaeramoeba ignava TaxID=1746090 RepID=A0A9Q0LXW2_ANAIG|nr:fk506-binding protein [Anaeramoeba ignava]
MKLGKAPIPFLASKPLQQRANENKNKNKNKKNNNNVSVRSRTSSLSNKKEQNQTRQRSSSISNKEDEEKLQSENEPKTNENEKLRKVKTETPQKTPKTKSQTKQQKNIETFAKNFSANSISEFSSLPENLDFFLAKQSQNIRSENPQVFNQNEAISLLIDERNDTKEIKKMLTSVSFSVELALMKLENLGRSENYSHNFTMNDPMNYNSQRVQLIMKENGLLKSQNLEMKNAIEQLQNKIHQDHLSDSLQNPKAVELERQNNKLQAMIKHLQQENLDLKLSSTEPKSSNQIPRENIVLKEKLFAAENKIQELEQHLSGQIQSPQFSVKQSENQQENPQNAMEEAKKLYSKQIDDQQKKISLLENQIKEIRAKKKIFEEKIRKEEKDQAKQLIRQIMNEVYHSIQDEFQDENSYDGKAVQKTSANIIRTHTLNALKNFDSKISQEDSKSDN